MLIEIKYEDITLKSLLNLIEVLPGYVFKCDGDRKVIIVKEKVNDKE